MFSETVSLAIFGADFIVGILKKITVRKLMKFLLKSLFLTRYFLMTWNTLPNHILSIVLPGGGTSSMFFHIRTHH